MDLFPIEQLAFWPHLTAQEQQDLKDSVRRMDYDQGQLIRSSERDCLGALVIQQGVIRLSLTSEDGREATIARMTAGEVCVLTASCMLSAITFDVQVQAETASSALVIPVQLLSRLKGENLYVENFVYKSAVERFSDAIRAVEQMLFMTLEQRVVSYLLDESARLGSDTIQVTQERMAQAIGSAREAVTRTLKKLSEAGAVELFRGGVRLVDRKALYARVS